MSSTSRTSLCRRPFRAELAAFYPRLLYMPPWYPPFQRTVYVSTNLTAQAIPWGAEGMTTFCFLPEAAKQRFSICRCSSMPVPCACTDVHWCNTRRCINQVVQPVQKIRTCRAVIPGYVANSPTCKLFMTVVCKAAAIFDRSIRSMCCCMFTVY